MLNRTLSANLNGLNLGTRTLANGLTAGAGLNLVVDASRLRQFHPRKRQDQMRFGEARAMKDVAISIRGSIAPSPSPISPPVSPSWPYPAAASRTRAEVVVGRVVSVTPTERATETGRSRTHAGHCARGWRSAPMTRLVSNPVATLATGG